MADLQTLVDDLLLLARSDAGAVSGPTAAVDLDDLVLDEVRGLAYTSVRFDLTGVSGAQLEGVEADLRRMIRNLLSNAAAHARSVVAVTLQEQDDTIVLHVDDDGEGIPYFQRLDVFERFARLDPSRTSSTGGTGLGLAIVKDVVIRHGGNVHIDDSPLGGARFTVEFPIRDVPRPARSESLRLHRVTAS